MKCSDMHPAINVLKIIDKHFDLVSKRTISTFYQYLKLNNPIKLDENDVLTTFYGPTDIQDLFSEIQKNLKDLNQFQENSSIIILETVVKHWKNFNKKEFKFFSSPFLEESIADINVWNRRFPDDISMAITKIFKNNIFNIIEEKKYIIQSFFENFNFTDNSIMGGFNISDSELWLKKNLLLKCATGKYHAPEYNFWFLYIKDFAKTQKYVLMDLKNKDMKVVWKQLYENVFEHLWKIHNFYKQLKNEDWGITRYLRINFDYLQHRQNFSSVDLNDFFQLDSRINSESFCAMGARNIYFINKRYVSIVFKKWIRTYNLFLNKLAKDPKFKKFDDCCSDIINDLSQFRRTIQEMKYDNDLSHEKFTTICLNQLKDIAPFNNSFIQVKHLSLNLSEQANEIWKSFEELGTEMLVINEDIDMFNSGYYLKYYNDEQSDNVPMRSIILSTLNISSVVGNHSTYISKELADFNGDDDYSKIWTNLLIAGFTVTLLLTFLYFCYKNFFLMKTKDSKILKTSWKIEWLN